MPNKTQHLLIKTKTQNIKIIVDLPEVLLVYVTSVPQSGLSVNGRDKRPFFIDPAARSPARASLGSAARRTGGTPEEHESTPVSAPSPGSPGQSGWGSPDACPAPLPAPHIPAAKRSVSLPQR